MPFGGALVPLGVMGIRASGKGLLGDRAAGGIRKDLPVFGRGGGTPGSGATLGH